MAQQPADTTPAASPAPEQLITAVEDTIAQFLRDRPLPENLREAMSYALLGGGKRLRPLLVLQSCAAVQGQVQDALPPAAALEMIHAFSLVHDDLPAMDDDDLRRGRPTLHIHTSQAMAILAGDALTSLAFEIILEKISRPQLAAQLVRELARGTTDMIAGQVYDTIPQHEPGLTDLQRLEQIHHHKTGALLRCACRMGALVGNANDEQLHALTQYAKAVGLMFQVVDDLLDVTQTAQQLGKAANKDAEKGKLTYPGLLGIDATREQVKQLHQQAKQALEPLGRHADALHQLADYMAVRQK